MAITTQTSAKAASAGSGLTHQSARVKATVSPVNSAIQGLRRPARSATAPSTGLSSAMATPAAVMAAPHFAVPSTGSPITPRAK